MRPVLELRGVGLERSGAWPVREVDLQLARGDRLAILGRSGSGKTSLLRLILGLESPSTGEIRLNGRLASRPREVNIPPEDRQIAMIFQDLALWPHMSIAEHLDFVLRAQRVPQSEREELIHQALAWVDLTSHAKRRPAALSGGEQRRVAIARALVMQPQLLLLDEPMANLDVALKRELLELLGRLLDEREHPTIYVTHDAREALALTDTVAVMEGGTVVQRGTWQTLTAEPATAFIREIVADLSRPAEFEPPAAPRSEHPIEPAGAGIGFVQSRGDSP
jgi:iron(III) transport system ATP-binding protein